MHIRVNGVWINSILYAYNAVLIAEKLEDLQQLVNMIGEHSKSIGLTSKLRIQSL